MMRSEEEALAGFLRIRIGGNTVDVPTLKIKHSRKWKAEVTTAMGSVMKRLPDANADNADWLKPIANAPTEVMLDLVLAYDTTNVLGGRKAVEDNADDREVWEALQQMLGATFPFVAALRSVAAGSGDELRQMFAGYLRDTLARVQTSQQRVSSMNGHSATGVSTLTPLAVDSPTSST